MDGVDPRRPTPLLWRVGRVTFDEVTGAHALEGVRIQLETRSRQIFATLLAARGRVVPRKELVAAGWGPGAEVNETSLNVAISKIRKAVGDPDFIKAERGRGYWLTHAVTCEPSPNTLPAFTFSPGEAIPLRPGWRLLEPLAADGANDVWLAQHESTGERRIFKFAVEAERVEALRYELRAARRLRDKLPDDDAYVPVLEADFTASPARLESAYGGPDLLAWANQRNGLASVPVETRIAIMAELAAAVGRAHSVGVIHGDLQPRNVVIDERNGVCRPRLVDFGAGDLVGAAEAAVEHRSLHKEPRETARRHLGALPYAAPELGHSGQPTILSDVFSLGMLLYHMVTGEFGTTLPPGWEANLPGAVLAGDVAAAAAGKPEERLSSALDLAQRLRTLAVREENYAEQARKNEQTKRLEEEAAIRRRRQPWVIASYAGLVSAALLLGVHVRQLLQSARALSEEVKTERALTDFMTNNFIASANYEKVGRANLTVADAARLAALQIDPAFSSRRPEIRAKLHGAMAVTFVNLSENDRAVTEADLALKAAREEVEPDWQLVTRAELAASVALLSQGRIRDATARVDAAGYALTHLYPPPADLQAWYLDSRASLAGVALDLGKYARLEAEAARISAASLEVPDWLRTRILLSTADGARMSGRLREAEEILLQVLRKQRTTFGAEDARTCYTEIILASTLRGEGRLQEGFDLVNHALPVLRRTLGDGARRTIIARTALAELYFRSGAYAKSGQVFLEIAAGLARSGLPSEHHVVAAEINAAQSFLLQNDKTSAERVLRLIRAQQHGTVPDDAPQAEVARFDLAFLLMTLGRASEVPALLHGLKADILRQDEIGPGWPVRLTFMEAWLAMVQGSDAKAPAAFARARLPMMAAKDEMITPEIVSMISRQLATASGNSPAH